MIILEIFLVYVIGVIISIFLIGYINHRIQIGVDKGEKFPDTIIYGSWLTILVFGVSFLLLHLSNISCEKIVVKLFKLKKK